MTQSDKWKKRKCVVRYREYKDQLRVSGLTVTETGCRLIFIIPMPKSWSKKKRAAMDGQPHLPRPDTDNLLKGLWDGLYGEDSHFFHADALKFWGETGAILVEKIPQAIRLEGNHIVWSEAA